ncbi:MAG: tRNA dihydrouridine synthase DusB [Pseudomonadales bacterium]|nr:tRNA dihydrouridine synthase DusB [Pseudomonadales bacterium]
MFTAMGGLPVVAIGPYKLANSVLLAPMAGITDLPFRHLAWRLGAGLVYGEMTVARPDLWHTRKSIERRTLDRRIQPAAVQIAGAEPKWMADAAQRHADDGAQIIDINMGCPAKKVCDKAAGSALLRDEGLVRSILEAVVKAVDVPVTLKIRTGWCPNTKNAVTIARIAEASGVSALTVHGRTRACRFKGCAEYQTVSEVVTSVAIPVFANGDIGDVDKAKSVVERTGAAGVMIGRSALGAPWLPGYIARGLAGKVAQELDFVERVAIMREHLDAMHRFYGVERGVKIVRKHVQWYLQRLQLDEQRIKLFNRLDDPESQQRFLSELNPTLDKAA